MVQHCSPPRPAQGGDVYLRRKIQCFSPPAPPSPPSPITPVEDDDDSTLQPHSLSQPDIAACDQKLAIEERLSRAVHVLSTEATALQNITDLYSSDRLTRDSFIHAVDAIVHSQRPPRHGKVVVIGVGKSGHIARKVVATLNSISVRAVFLHPTEALHGDLGLVSPNDVLLLITFSGRTPELLGLLPYLDRAIPLLLLTGHARRDTCELLHHRPDAILLPAPVHEDETRSFGVAAPTTSTTVALAVADALAMVVAQELHSDCVPAVFARNHPGGAIGAALKSSVQPAPPPPPPPPTQRDIRSVMVPVEQIPYLDEAAAVGMTGTVTGLDVLRAAYASPSGWLRVREPDVKDGFSVLTPMKIRRIPPGEITRPVFGGSTGSEGNLSWLVTPEKEFIHVAAGEEVGAVAEWVRGLRARTTTASGVSSPSLSSSSVSSCSDFGSLGFVSDENKGEETAAAYAYGDEAVIAVVERGKVGRVVGLLEVGSLLELA
ncbi:hypothetical protein VTJ04DRAFT_8302 [Mycothermus thermophilus]|uniref:uncharacterized protein n=1 Tax=Humicola insolens TaxID=85995 RepID=UPI0037433581